MPFQNNPPAIIANPAAFSPQNTLLWEWIAQDEAPEEDTLSTEGSVGSMAGWLKDHDSLWNAVAYFVGYSRTDYPNSSTKLIRWLPAVHPRWPMMRCTTVSVKGLKRLGHADPRPPFNQLGAYRLPLPKYERYRFDVHFEQPQYNYVPDEIATSEWDRFITIDPADETEIITVDGGQYLYNAPTDASLNAKLVAINSPYLKVYAQRSGLIVTAYQVPMDFIMDFYGLPLHFMAAKGKVNSTTFLGRPPQTMLLQNYEIIKRAQPIATSQFSTLLFGCTVKMHFGFTDPDRAEVSETRRGWNLVPAIRGTGTKWYGVYNRYDPTQNLYPEYDMNKLLQHWST